MDKSFIVLLSALIIMMTLSTFAPEQRMLHMLFSAVAIVAGIVGLVKAARRKL